MKIARTMDGKRGSMLEDPAVNPTVLPFIGRRLLKSLWFLPALQGGGILLLITGVLLGFAGSQECKSSWTHWIFWDLWWQGGLVLILFTIGKAWCGICPLRTVNRMAERFSLGIPFPKQLQNIVVSIVMYIVAVRLILYLPGVALPKSPWNTAVYFLAFVMLAVFIGISFKRGSFCRFVCPISSATDVYAMAAPVALRPDRRICENCNTRDCVTGNRYAPGCRYGLFPGNLQSDRHCTFCLDCIKSCPNDSMHFQVRPLFSGIWKEIRPNAGESFLSVIIFTLVFFRMGVGHHPAWTDMTSLIGVAPGTDYFSAAKYLIRFVISLGLVITLFYAACKLSALVTGDVMKKHYSVFGYGYIPFCIVVGLFQYGWFDLGHIRLTVPLVIGTALSLLSIWKLGRAHLEENNSSKAAAVHMALMAVLSLTILVFQNLWPMRMS